MGKCIERVFKKMSLKKKKMSLKPNAASHYNTSWYTDTDGFLEHLPSGESLYYKGPTLQKIIRGGAVGSPLIYKTFCTMLGTQ